MRAPGDVLMVTTGIMLQRALAAADLARSAGNLMLASFTCTTVKPLDIDALGTFDLAAFKLLGIA